MMADVERVKADIQLVRELSNELAGHIHALPDGIWRDPEQFGSPCEGWKVADVIAHLIEGATLYSLSVGRALKGESSPPMGHRSMGRQEATEALISLRGSYDEDLFLEFNGSCKQLNTLLVSLESKDFKAPAFHSFFGAIPVSRLIELRVLELAVHGWDVRYSLDRSATLSEKALPFLTGWMQSWFSIGFQKSDMLVSPVTYRFRLNEPVTESYDVVITGDDFSLQPSDGADADVTFSCDTNTYILLGMGRLPFARSVRRGRLSFEGDEKLASQFTDWFGPV